MASVWIGALLCAGAVSAQQPRFFPVADIRPGMVGVGKTVFAGNKIEEFKVEFLGVLENLGPKQSLILGRLSGGPLERTGIMQGMSGSPVYIDGRLAGAVAMAFPFSKEPIAGIRPIEEMLQASKNGPPRALRASGSPWTEPLTAPFGGPQEAKAGPARLIDIATPVSLAGFTSRTLDQFAPQLRSLGLEPVQGLAAGGRPTTAPSGTKLEPGAMISVQLITGDLVLGADGTVTYVDGDNLYAFGHRFLSIGPAEMPFARADVLALMPNLNASFKISAAREWMGSITADRNTAIFGKFGHRAAMVPVSIAVDSESTGPKHFQYRMEMVRDALLTPFLLQMAVFNALDATERMIGTSSLTLRGSIELENGQPPIRLDNTFAGDFNVPLLASVAVSAPLAYALQSNFASLQVRNVSLELGFSETKKQVNIESAWASRREAKPGETIEITANLVGENGKEMMRKTAYTVPIGAPSGTLYFSVSDGTTLNAEEYRVLLTTPPRTAEQLIGALNRLRGNSKAFLRVWRAEPDFSIQGQNLPDPPPSVGMILAKTQPVGSVPSRSSRVDELSWDLGNMLVSGSKTIQVEIKE